MGGVFTVVSVGILRVNVPERTYRIGRFVSRTKEGVVSPGSPVRVLSGDPPLRNVVSVAADSTTCTLLTRTTWYSSIRTLLNYPSQLPSTTTLADYPPRTNSSSPIADYTATRWLQNRGIAGIGPRDSTSRRLVPCVQGASMNSYACDREGQDTGIMLGS